VSTEPEREVLREERALQSAMVAGDVPALDRLLHPALLAVGPDGQLIDKAGDLLAHRSGVFEIAELDEEEMRVKVVGDTAMTFVVLRVRGTIDGAEVSGPDALHAHVDSRWRRVAGARRTYRSCR
jgi:hypothetical protein